MRRTEGIDSAGRRADDETRIRDGVVSLLETVNRRVYICDVRGERESRSPPHEGFRRALLRVKPDAAKRVPARVTVNWLRRARRPPPRNAFTPQSSQPPRARARARALELRTETVHLPPSPALPPCYVCDDTLIPYFLRGRAPVVVVVANIAGSKARRRARAAHQSRIAASLIRLPSSPPFPPPPLFATRYTSAPLSCAILTRNSPRHPRYRAARIDSI